MAFERSLNGQSNRALFFGVDMVIYVEGGRETGTAVESYDGMFWKKVFQAVRPELRVRTIPKGSKRNLLGSGLVDQSQKMMVAARATAEKKAVGHRS